VEDGRKRAAVALEAHDFGFGILAKEDIERAGRCATEAVYGLVGVADREQVSVFASEKTEDADLGEVNVLEFIGEDVAGSGLLFLKNFGIGVKQIEGAGDHVAEGAKRFVGEPGFDGFEDSGDFLTAGKDFFFR